MADTAGGGCGKNIRDEVESDQGGGSGVFDCILLVRRWFVTIFSDRLLFRGATAILVILRITILRVVVLFWSLNIVSKRVDHIPRYQLGHFIGTGTSMFDSKPCHTSNIS